MVRSKPRSGDTGRPELSCAPNQNPGPAPKHHPIRDTRTAFSTGNEGGTSIGNAQPIDRSARQALIDSTVRGEAEPAAVGPENSVGTADTAVGLVYRTGASMSR
jgi:hypothetical protein